jgi:hypothetical protein
MSKNKKSKIVDKGLTGLSMVDPEAGIPLLVAKKSGDALKNTYKKTGEIGDKLEKTKIGQKITNKKVIANTGKVVKKLAKKLKPRKNIYKGKDIKMNKDFHIKKVKK